MSLCPTCKATFSGGEQFCPRDGTPLRPSLPDDPLSGRVFSGRYRLLEPIGRGGMGAVYRAHHILMDKPVAVKVLRGELAGDIEAVARFHREARSASRLDHECIIRVTDFGQTDDGLLFLVMELLDGENLAQVIRQGTLPWRRAATIAREIAQGLSHAHEQGVIHRDLKPENVIVSRRAKGRLQVKVLDFGLAKLFRGSSENSDEEPGRALTKTGMVFGTPEYMSPEQAEGKKLGPDTDLYALGVVLFQMVTGRLPFSAPTLLALIAKTVQDPPPRPTEVAPEAKLPEALETLILRCLEKDPEERPSAEQIADELDSLLARHVGEAPMEHTTPPGPSSGPITSGANVVAKTVQRLQPFREATVAPVGPSTDTVGTRPTPHTSPVGPVETRENHARAEPGPLASPDAQPHENSPKPSLDEPEPVLDDESTEHTSQASQGDTFRLPHRPYWVFGVLVLLLGGGLAFVVKKRVSATAATSGPTDELQRAKQLLAQDKSRANVEAATRALLALRPKNDSTELHHQLALAYEAQNQRLRALGHAHLAVQRAKTMAERSVAQLALSQLLSRLGHTAEACQIGLRLLREKPLPEKEVQVHAAALISTLKCY